MTVREVRVSPDRQAIAIRGDAADTEAWNAWAVMHAVNGGHWSASRELDGWEVLEVPEAEPQPEPQPAQVLTQPPPLQL